VAVDPIRPVEARRDAAPVTRTQLLPAEREQRRREREQRRRERREAAPGRPDGTAPGDLDIRV
jgi:hypothetical protein